VGKFDSIRAYNKEFTRWLLQVPLMGHVERLFHYSQGLKRHIRIEVERADCDTLHDAMKVADKMDSIYSQNSSQRSGYDRGSYNRFQNHHPSNFPSHSIGRGTMEMDQPLRKLVTYLKGHVRGTSYPLRSINGIWMRNYALCATNPIVVLAITGVKHEKTKHSLQSSRHCSGYGVRDRL